MASPRTQKIALPEQDLSVHYRTKFDPSCIATLDENGEYVDDVYEISDFVAQLPDFSTLPASQLARLFAHLKTQFDAMDAVRDEFSKLIELLKNVKIPEAFEREGVKNFTFEDGSRVTLTSRVTASIVADQQEAAFNWLRENGYPDTIKETVNSSTMSATAKEILENVETLPNGMVRPIDPDMPFDLPVDLFNVTFGKSTSFTKGKPKKG